MKSVELFLALGVATSLSVSNVSLVNAEESFSIGEETNIPLIAHEQEGGEGGEEATDEETPVEGGEGGEEATDEETPVEGGEGGEGGEEATDEEIPAEGGEGGEGGEGI